MYSCNKLFMRSLECYLGIYFPRCCATLEINTKITLSSAHKQFATRVHTLFYISWVRFWWYSPDSNFTLSIQATVLHKEFENYTFKITATFPRNQWVNNLLPHRRQGTYLYRPTRIAERFPNFLLVVTCEVYHLTNKFLLTCWGFSIG